jgi:hypothetical protein
MVIGAIGEPCDFIDRVSAPLRPAGGSGDCRYLEELELGD